MKDKIQDIIIDIIPEQESFKEVLPEYDGNRLGIILEPVLDFKTGW